MLALSSGPRRAELWRIPSATKRSRYAAATFSLSRSCARGRAQVSINPPQPTHGSQRADSLKDDPRWFSFDVKWKRKLKNYVHLRDLKDNAKLGDMKVVQRGQRLSVQPVTKKEWTEVCKMGGVSPA